jgi:hypothetical protein
VLHKLKIEEKGTVNTTVVQKVLISSFLKIYSYNSATIMYYVCTYVNRNKEVL